MVTVKIGGDSRELHSRREIDEAWISQQISGRKRDGQRICIQVLIIEGDINLVLSSSGCVGSLGSPREATTAENEILKLWNNRRLNIDVITTGSLIAFLKELPILKT